MLNYEIEITGSGTADEIIKSLETLIESIKAAKEDKEFYKATWEDSTLCTEFSVEDETEEEYNDNPARHIDDDYGLER